MLLMVYLHYNWPRERHSQPPCPPRGLSGGTLALSLARRGGKLTSVVLFPVFNNPIRNMEPTVSNYVESWLSYEHPIDDWIQQVAAVILLDWILIGALDGARPALEMDPLILFVDWSGFETVELLELQTYTHSDV
jgi:hypothetical protein